MRDNPWILGSGRAVMACGLALLASPPAWAQIDGVVQRGLISHSPFIDRRPLCPMSGEAFDVYFQTAKGDLSGARVGVDGGADGTGIVWIDATQVGSRGVYDTWKATIPATTPGSKEAYVLELSDGADVAYLSTAGVGAALPGVASWYTLDFTTLIHAPVGATPTASGTVFRVWAPGATSAQVRSEAINNWGVGTSMTKRGEYFYAVVPGVVAGKKYKYYFNNSTWKPDPRSPVTGSGDAYNSQVINQLGYVWANPNFVPAPRERWVIYQLHVGNFSGLNDPKGSFTRVGKYSDVTSRADHLAALGVNCVMLNPINEFPTDVSGGYNPVSMWSFESAYGTPDELKGMIDALHARGIAVILDVVWNHFSPSDNFLWNYDTTQVYFDNPAVNTPWGSQGNFDRQPVWDYFYDSVDYLLGTYKFNGLRFDALANIISDVQYASGQTLIRATTDLAHRRYADAHIIGEVYNTSAWNTSTAGMNLDGQYHDTFKNALRNAVGAAASGNPDLTSLAGAIDGEGANLTGDKVMNYFELHDDAWATNGNSRAVAWIDTTPPSDDQFATSRTKLAQGVSMFAMGMPAILQGTEWLESIEWGSKIDWSKKTTYAPVFKYYQDIIKLRTTRPGLFANAATSVYILNDSSNYLGFSRTGSDASQYVVLANFANTGFSQLPVGVPAPGPWGVILASEDAQYRGSGTGTMPGCLKVQNIAAHGKSQRVLVDLPARGLLVLQLNPEYLAPTTRVCACNLADITDASGVGNPDGQLTGSDVVTFFQSFFGVCTGSTPCNPADITDGAGTGAPDGSLTGSDVVSFFQAYFSACN